MVRTVRISETTMTEPTRPPRYTVDDRGVPRMRLSRPFSRRMHSEKARLV